MSLPSSSKKNNQPWVAIVLAVLLGTGLVIAAFLLGKHVRNLEIEQAEESSAVYETAKINNSVVNPKVSDFVFGETSKIYITDNGENKREITAFVTNYNGGDLCVNTAGLGAIFALKETTMTDEDKTEYLKKEQEAGFASAGDEYLKLSNGTQTLIFKEGSKFYTCNGEGAVLSSAVVRSGDQLSIPVTNLVFVFGYDSLGVSAEADSVTYTLIK